MSREALLEMQLRGLHLPGMLANYQRLLKEHAEPLPYFADLVALETSKRQENGVRARIAAAHFPTIKSIEAFDFSAQPTLPKAKLLEHFDGAFVEQHRNIIFSGPPGLGKTHLLIALGLSMCMRGYRTLFTTAAALLVKLMDAKRNGGLERHLRTLDRIDVLLIDELGYIPCEREASDLLFQVISQRYERRSIALTTNLPFERWGEIFPEEMTATAVIDRLIHHGSLFVLTGESHRLRTRKKA